jgi:hypothetical protein
MVEFRAAIIACVEVGCYPMFLNFKIISLKILKIQFKIKKNSNLFKNMT